MAESDSSPATRLGDNNKGFQINQNYGPVSGVYLPPERRETPPSPSDNIPFPQDAYFIDRPALFDQIDAKLARPASRVALVGFGGVGKSQLVIEYGHRVRKKLPDTWVFWVHASNADRFEESFWQIANRAKIYGRTKEKVNIFQLVHDWLHDVAQGKWLLILDNMDETEFLDERPKVAMQGGIGPNAIQTLRQYLPPSAHGSILITSRSERAAMTLVESENIVAVEPMDEEEAFALLTAKLQTHDEVNRVGRGLIIQLEHMPLAIVQAAAYIRDRGPRYSIMRYIAKFRSSERGQKSLLQHTGGQTRRDRDAENSILVTWRISFEHIRKTRRSAANLLALMSFYDHQGIPESLVRPQHVPDPEVEGRKAEEDIGLDSDGSTLSATSEAEEKFEDDILLLRQYSFISLTQDAAAFKMHRLVQLATRAWLRSQKQLEQWRDRYIGNLRAQLPSGGLEGLGIFGDPRAAVFRVLYPHVMTALEHRPSSKESLKDWAQVMHSAAHYARSKRHGEDAEQMATKAMEVRQELLEQDNPDVLCSMITLAQMYFFRERLMKAEQLLMQVMGTMSQVPHDEHLHALNEMDRVVRHYQVLGRWKEAERLVLLVIEMSTRALGDVHHSTRARMSCLANIYEHQGRETEALQLEVQVIEKTTRAYGGEDPATVSWKLDHAHTLWKVGRHDEAMKLMGECVEIRKQRYGSNDFSTIRCVWSLQDWEMTIENRKWRDEVQRWKHECKDDYDGKPLAVSRPQGRSRYAFRASRHLDEDGNVEELPFGKVFELRLMR